jgi:hypothetical protein
MGFRLVRLNTPTQIANGRALLRKYGSWQRIREVSRYDFGRGVLVLDTGREP